MKKSETRGTFKGTRKAFIDISIIKTVSIFIAIFLSYIQPYFGGVVGSLLYMSWAKTDEEFNIFKAFQKITGGWAMALLLVEYAIHQEVFMRDAFNFSFALSVFAGIISFPFLRWAIDEKGIKRTIVFVAERYLK